MIATGQPANPQPRRAARRTFGYWLRLVGIALLGGFVAALAVALAVVPPWMADRILHPPRRELTATPADLGVAYEDVTLRGQDVDLSGWYVPGEGDSAVVLVHGFPNDRSNLLALVPALHAAGFPLLLYDQRATGASGGDAVTFGYYEADDLIAAVDYLRARSGARKVGAIGVSMGASTALLASTHGAAIDAVVADSAFADLEALATEGTPVRLFVLGQILHPLWRVMSPLVLWHAERQSGLRAAAVRPVEHIAEISPRPLLLIHGQEDGLFSYQNSVTLYAAAREPKTLWLVPEADHIGAYGRGPAEYTRRVVEFLSGALAPTATGTSAAQGAA